MKKVKISKLIYFEDNQKCNQVIPDDVTMIYMHISSNAIRTDNNLTLIDWLLHIIPITHNLLHLGEVKLCSPAGHHKDTQVKWSEVKSGELVLIQSCNRVNRANETLAEYIELKRQFRSLDVGLTDASCYNVIRLYDVILQKVILYTVKKTFVITIHFLWSGSNTLRLND